MEWFSSTDAAQLAKLPFSAAMAACVPVRHWDRVADLAVRAGASVTRRPVKDTVSRLLRHLDPSDLDEPVDAVACRCLRNIHIDRLATLRSHDPRGWRITAEVEGLDHIRASWTAGRGVILWVAPFAFGGLVTKRAMHEAGVPVHRRNIRPDHPGSDRQQPEPDVPSWNSRRPGQIKHFPSQLWPNSRTIPLSPCPSRGVMQRAA